MVEESKISRGKCWKQDVGGTTSVCWGKFWKQEDVGGATSVCWGKQCMETKLDEGKEAFDIKDLSKYF